MRSGAFEVYLREVRRHPRPSPEEEDRLARAFAVSRDPEFAGRLVLANLLLVVRIAQQHCRSQRRLPDLVQEGNLGLLQAVQRFDPHRGVKLCTYAAWWIRAYMLRYLLNNARLVKVGTTPAQRKLFFGMNRMQRRLERAGIAPTAGALAEALEVPEETIAEMQARLAGGAEAAVVDADALSSVSAGPDVTAAAGQLRDRLREKLCAFGETLTGRDQVLFRDRLLAEAPAPLRELGARFGTSGESARRHEARLLARLRVYLQEELGDAVQELGDAA